MFNWLKKKSAELQKGHIMVALVELVEVANVAHENIQRTHMPNHRDVKAVRKAKDKFIRSLWGPLPMEQVRKDFIDPLLRRQDVSHGARMAIEHAFDFVVKSTRD